jgi:carbon-monoxide dehydrogenase iron sulfur subunit
MVVEIKVDYRRCTGCRKCVDACTFGVLESFEEQPIVRNPSSCSACLKCCLCCPTDAIIVKQK